MPSYLDFETTKKFRDFILGKTLSAPNGPKTFTAANYSIQSTRDMANTDPGAVDSNIDSELLQSQNANVFKPLEYSVREEFNTIPRKANLSLYPYFIGGQNHNIIGIMNTTNYDTESELMKFAAWNIKENPEGPFYARLQQNLYNTTVGKIRLIDALEGNTATAINLITGREPLIESNARITVAKTALGKGIDFLQTVGGVEFPWAEIPGDYLSNPKNPVQSHTTPQTRLGGILRDITGAIGSLVGIERRPTTTKKPSDLFIDYMGERQKSTLFDNLTYSKYAPDYTTTARSQNSSKIFNFVDQFAQGVRSMLGTEAPRGVSYIGNDRDNDVRYAMNDFNDRPVKSNYYLGLLFDPVQAELFQRKKNIGEGGSIGGKLTWISNNSKNILGANNNEYSSESSQYLDTLSTNYDFREDSILGLTQELLNTLPSEGGASRSHVANVIDQTSRVFREGDVMLSRGSAIKYVDKFTKQESGVEYCRVWTKDRSYMNYSDTMKRQGNVRKFESSILSAPWNLNIYPNSNGNGGFDSGSTNMARGKGDGFYAKKYMFSIENLAWKTSNRPGFTYNDLPYCERGPNGGRIMWFPPYDLKVNEQNNAKWEENVFLGRPEPVYTYQNTTRGGQVSFKVIVDHPSILNLLVKEHFKNMSDEESDNYINAFFAGCEEVDFYGLIRKYTTLTPTDIQAIKAYLNQNKDPQTVTRYKTIIDPVEDTNSPKNSPTSVEFKSELYFKNDFPRKGGGEELLTNDRYSKLYNDYIEGESVYMTQLNNGLNRLFSGSSWNGDQRNDYKVLYSVDTKTRPSPTEITQMRDKVTNFGGFAKLEEEYTNYNNKLLILKNSLSGKTIEDIKVQVGSRTSSIADDNYNVKLAYRRSYSIITDMLDKLAGPAGSRDAIVNVQWSEKVSNTDKEKIETKPIIISFKDLGYDGQDGKLTIEYVANVGEQPLGSNPSSIKNVDCTDANKILTSSDLKQTAPITFWCRESIVNIQYTTKPSDTPNVTAPVPQTHLVEVTDTPTGSQSSPPIDELKRIIMRTLSECYYFKKLEEESPLQFSSLKEKLRYFHPAFHSMTPEGLNSRLTFLNQCVRPGDTLPIKGVSDTSDLNARNTTFGPPPILVMRIGDFYHSKIIIRDVNIDFEDNLWDLNPEGIGVQPMIANVTLQVSFIGGHGLEKPVEQLQNALSSNFYANTEMYDPRSTATEDRSKFTKEFLEDLVKNNDAKLNSNTTSQTVPTTKITQGSYIGVLSNNSLNYKTLIDGLYSETKSYFTRYEESYNLIVSSLGLRIAELLVSPRYRTIYEYDVQTGGGTDTIEFLGEYKKGEELEILCADFKSKILDKIENENISTLFGFDKDMSTAVLAQSEELLKPYVSKTIGNTIDALPQYKSLKDIANSRNKLIVHLDKLNFIVENLGHDGQIKDNQYIGVNITGYTSDMIYPKYSSVISFIQEEHSKFTEDLDDSYYFNRNTTMTTNDLSYFLSELLKSEDINILKLYQKNTTVFTDKILKNIEKRLKKFLAPYPSDKKFRFKYLEPKDSNNVSFNIVDELYTFNNTQIENLIKVHKTSGNKTTSVLNYFR